jgi:hypothetical protein
MLENLSAGFQELREAVGEVREALHLLRDELKEFKDESRNMASGMYVAFSPALVQLNASGSKSCDCNAAKDG